MKSNTRSPAIRRAVEKAKRLGYTVHFVEFVPTASCPMLILPEGLCDEERKEIRVSTRGNSRAKILAILEHELEHAEGKEIATDRPEFGLVCGGTVSRSTGMPSRQVG